MFCTSCHTGFHWNSLQICKSGEIHNPHYYEYLAANGNNVNNANNVNNEPQCYRNADGVGLQPFHLRQQLRATYERHTQTSFHLSQHTSVYWSTAIDKIETFNRILSHCHFYFPRTPDHNDDEQVIRYRCEYLGKHIGREEFKRRIFIKERQQSFQHARLELYSMFSTCGTDILHRYFANSAELSKTGMNNCLNEIFALIHYVNDSAEKSATLYNVLMLFVFLKHGPGGTYFTAETFTKKKWVDRCEKETLQNNPIVILA
jgi:hypothetical protein